MKKTKVSAKGGYKFNLKREFRANKYLYLMFLSVFIWYVVFAYIPM